MQVWEFHPTSLQLQSRVGDISPILRHFDSIISEYLVVVHEVECVRIVRQTIDLALVSHRVSGERDHVAHIIAELPFRLEAIPVVLKWHNPSRRCPLSEPVFTVIGYVGGSSSGEPLCHRGLIVRIGEVGHRHLDIRIQSLEFVYVALNSGNGVVPGREA